MALPELWCRKGKYADLHAAELFLFVGRIVMGDRDSIS